MAINLTKFNFQEDLTSQTFNQKLTEMQTHLNNLSATNERLIRENQTLRQQLNNKVEVKTVNTIDINILNDPAYPNNYETDTNLGKQIGLPVDWVYIKYFKHAYSSGYGAQIAIPFESGFFSTMYIRNAVGNTWGAWNNMRSLGNAENNAYRNTYNANTAIESGKLYYCVYNQCQNLPKGTQDDGILISYMHRTDTLYGYQIYMTWNNDSLWTRNVINNTFTAWREFLTTKQANLNPITDANLALENGKTYYCVFNGTANIPYTHDDGIIQVFSMNNGKDAQTVCFQMWYSWNSDCVCFRKCIWGNWYPWKKIATVNV